MVEGAGWPGNPAALPRLTRLKQTKQKLSQSLSGAAPGAFGAGSDAKQERSKARKSASRGAQLQRATHGSLNGKRLYLTPSTTPSAAKTQDGSGTVGGHGQDGGALARVPRAAQSTGGSQSRDARVESLEQPAFRSLLLLLPSFQNHPKAFRNSPKSLRSERPRPLSHRSPVSPGFKCLCRIHHTPPNADASFPAPSWEPLNTPQQGKG